MGYSVQQQYVQAAAERLCTLRSLTDAFQHLQEPFGHLLHTGNKR